MNVSAVELGATVAAMVLRNLEPLDVADVIVGNVLQAGQGMNPARQVALLAGLPVSTPGQTVNRVCGSSLQAIVSAVQGIRSGDGRLYLAGGIENMSAAPHLIPHFRAGNKMGDATVLDSMVHDGLTDPTHHYHMGITAENIAQRYGISRSEQDEYALCSQRKASKAQADGRFKAEIIPVVVASRKGPVLVDQDEGIRHDANSEGLARLKPSFQPDGTVTAGNASSLNDGAAMCAVSSQEYAAAHGLEPLAEILGYATVGVDPAVMGLGPSAAIPKALQRCGLTVDDVDLFELNEAFAAQSIGVIRDLALAEDRINVTGGGIALGHPIGASGARVVVTLVNSLRTMRKEIGIASLCIGGGMGIAIVVRAI